MPFEDYAEDCELYSPAHPSGNPFFNFVMKLDRFVIAHVFGWFCKARCLDAPPDDE